MEMARSLSSSEVDDSQEQSLEDLSTTSTTDQLNLIDILDNEDSDALEQSPQAGQPPDLDIGSKPAPQSLMAQAFDTVHASLVGAAARSQQPDTDKRKRKTEQLRRKKSTLPNSAVAVEHPRTTKPRRHKHSPSTTSNTLKDQLQQQAMQIQRLETEREKIKGENETLTEALEECKEQIFRMQPMDVASDANIGQQYEAFCRAVEAWADQQFGHAEGALTEIRSTLRGSHPLTGLLWGYLQNGELEVIEQADSSQVAMVRYILHRHLFERIVGRDKFHMCINSESETLLRNMLGNMQALIPRRGKYAKDSEVQKASLTHSADAETIRTWKAEAMRALASDHTLAWMRTQYIHNVAWELKTMLYPLLVWSGKYDWDDGGCIAMVEMASLFKEAIDYSPKTYVFDNNFSPSSTEMQQALHAEDLKNSTIVDRDSDQIVRSQARLEDDDQGRLGWKLCLIHSGLQRQNSEGESNTVLVKTALLAELRKQKMVRVAVSGRG